MSTARLAVQCSYARYVSYRQLVYAMGILDMNTAFDAGDACTQWNPLLNGDACTQWNPLLNGDACTQWNPLLNGDVCMYTVEPSVAGENLYGGCVQADFVFRNV